MAQVLITDTKLNTLARSISNKSGSNLPLTLDQMNSAVNNIETLNLQVKNNIMPTAANQTIEPDSQYNGLSSVTILGDTDLTASNIKHGVNIFNTAGTFGMKFDNITATPNSRGTTISFTGLKAQPIIFACNLEFEGSFSSARTIYSLIYDGTTLSNCTSYRSGSSILCYKYTTCTWTYSNGTLTITSPSTSSVGYFQPYSHHLIYAYEE